MQLSPTTTKTYEPASQKKLEKQSAVKTENTNKQNFETSKTGELRNSQGLINRIGSTIINLFKGIKDFLFSPTPKRRKIKAFAPKNKEGNKLFQVKEIPVSQRLSGKKMLHSCGSASCGAIINTSLKNEDLTHSHDSSHGHDGGGWDHNCGSHSCGGHSCGGHGCGSGCGAGCGGGCGGG